jgi:hypothetical protein
MNAPRKLALILAADIAGYSRLIGTDAADTAQALSRVPSIGSIGGKRHYA